MKKSTSLTKTGLSEMLKGGVIMDVVDAAQAKIAENAGACAVMALERVPAQIRKEGGVARASDPAMIKAIQEAVSIPVMAKCRIGHVMEARILEALEVDFIDESEVLTPADDEFHIEKRASRRRSFADAKTLARRSVASPRAPRFFGRRVKQARATSPKPFVTCERSARRSGSSNRSGEKSSCVRRRTSAH